MIVWSIPKKKSRIELVADGWMVYIKNHSWLFGSLSQCLCFLAGRQVIEYEDIPLLIRKTRERYE